MRIFTKFSEWRLRRRLVKHLAVADMATRRGQVKAERLRDEIDAIARREALR